MRVFTLILCIVMLAGCASSPRYQTKSVPEAKKLAELAVRLGMIPANQRASEEARLSAGKRGQGTWDQARMDRFLAKWAKENPRRAEINLAATRGTITEGQRLELMSRVDYA